MIFRFCSDLLNPKTNSSIHISFFFYTLNSIKLFTKSDVTKESDVHADYSSNINRRLLSSSKSSGEPSEPPTSSNNLLWLGAAAAIMIGGGAYLITNSHSEKNKPEEAAKVSAPPKKRKQILDLMAKFHYHTISGSH